MFDRKKYSEEYRKINREKQAQYNKDYYAANKEKQRIYMEEHKEERKEKRKLYVEKNKDYFIELNIKNKDYRRDMKYKRVYNFTLKEYSTLHAKQEGVCAICGLPERIRDKTTQQIKFLAVDHCHTTGNIRGLLCSLCNTAIGKLNDDPALLKKAILYLERPVDVGININKVVTDTATIQSV